ncbi:hypothetical protein EJ08DRAFT_663201 [Tothia fuscella]|uniref:Uncharacterized protein n=1 Tax=Tothia fuscella TaxID=1048955 RepID=A0A9P4NM87_9PEZI|nr:hypothetical protein EJ08DRAFT_663201 [Tothia fuscella]
MTTLGSNNTFGNLREGDSKLSAMPPLESATTANGPGKDDSKNSTLKNKWNVLNAKKLNKMSQEEDQAWIVEAEALWKERRVGSGEEYDENGDYSGDTSDKEYCGFMPLDRTAAYVDLYADLPSNAPADHPHLLHSLEFEGARMLDHDGDTPNGRLSVPDYLVTTLFYRSSSILETFLNLPAGRAFYYLWKASSRHYNDVCIARRNNDVLIGICQDLGQADRNKGNHTYKDFLEWQPIFHYKIEISGKWTLTYVNRIAATTKVAMFCNPIALDFHIGFHPFEGEELVNSPFVVPYTLQGFKDYLAGGKCSKDSVRGKGRVVIVTDEAGVDPFDEQVHGMDASEEPEDDDEIEDESDNDDAYRSDQEEDGWLDRY